jgi:hypothetical protein
MKQDIDEKLLHDFGTSSEGSIYLRGSSGALAASRSGTLPTSPIQPARPKRSEPISPLPPSYAEGLRPLPRSEYEAPRQPIYMDSWRDEPSDGPYPYRYQQQQMEEPRGQQMFMPLMQSQPQSEYNRSIIISFIFLVITLVIIYLIFFPH